MAQFDRRNFIRSALATALATRLPLSAQAQGIDNPRRIDVHHHFAPPAWVTDVRGRPLLNPANTTWRPEHSIEDMDNGGVAASVISITNPGLWFGDVAPTLHRIRYTLAPIGESVRHRRTIGRDLLSR